ncbi:M23 family metallopeptidase [Novosphingobium sp.]|uniref:M23 family metallopeptidase n=1 Tax=Novosphingobium sp. TaxID=1874826 RepID=UPI00286E1DD6|nr:M23 family metallopeptidase [Novosphingobium sp.]
MDRDDTFSFDPRAWSPARPEPASTVQPAEVAVPAALSNLRRMAMAGSGSLALIIGGVFLAWTLRDPVPAATPQAAASAPAPVQAVAATSKRILNLNSPFELEAALVANGVSAADAKASSNSTLTALGQTMQPLRVVINIGGDGAELTLQRLELSFLDSSGAVVTRQADGSFAASKVAASLSTQTIMRRGQKNDVDFYSSAVAAGITDSLVPTFAQAFVYDFNFQTEINTGDVFEAVFEQQVNTAGQPVGPPKLLYASMETPAKSRALYRYKPQGDEEGWFDGNGRSVRRSFMRTPVEGARISSHFGMRFHPVLHYTRLHGGIDLAAPTGTPIYAASAGTITAARPSGCAGNMVMIKHDNGWETHYFHLVKYAPDIQAGMRVEQGHLLGGVGMTGNCVTGPHLHYEIVINGEKVDPETIPTEEGKRLAGAELTAFIKERDRIDVARAKHAS